MQEVVRLRRVVCAAAGCVGFAEIKYATRRLPRFCRHYPRVACVTSPIGRYHYIVPRLQSVSLGVVEVVALLEIEYTVDEEFAYRLAV